MLLATNQKKVTRSNSIISVGVAPLTKKPEGSGYEIEKYPEEYTILEVKGAFSTINSVLNWYDKMKELPEFIFQIDLPSVCGRWTWQLSLLY